ncbi:MAG: hypothetical protein WBR33_25510, partial [Pseudonocardiaceae bacterium]
TLASVATEDPIANEHPQPTADPGRRPGKEHPTMSTSLDAQQLTTLLRLSSEPDTIGDDHPLSWTVLLADGDLATSEEQPLPLTALTTAWPATSPSPSTTNRPS